MDEDARDRCGERCEPRPEEGAEASAVRSCGVETDHVPCSCVAVPLDVCPDSFLPHFWILKMEHTVSVIFTVLLLLLACDSTED